MLEAQPKEFGLAERTHANIMAITFKNKQTTIIKQKKRTAISTNQLNTTSN